VTAVDYGSVPEEPEVDDSNSVKVSVKFPWGKQINRYICIYIYIYTCPYIHIHIYIFVCVYIYIYIYTYVLNIYICIYVCIGGFIKVMWCVMSMHSLL
jgi:hypothetical protein